MESTPKRPVGIQDFINKLRTTPIKYKNSLFKQVNEEENINKLALLGLKEMIRLKVFQGKLYAINKLKENQKLKEIQKVNIENPSETTKIITINLRSTSRYLKINLLSLYLNSIFQKLEKKYSYRMNFQIFQAIVFKPKFCNMNSISKSFKNTFSFMANKRIRSYLQIFTHFLTDNKVISVQRKWNLKRIESGFQSLRSIERNLNGFILKKIQLYIVYDNTRKEFAVAYLFEILSDLVKILYSHSFKVVKSIREIEFVCKPKD